MDLQEFVSSLNSSAFWQEFTFTQNKFSPKPKSEFELADNFIWLGDHAYILQLKERTVSDRAPEAEEKWFRKKVLGHAVRQVNDSLRFLKEHKEIRIANERGHPFTIRGDQIESVTKIVVFFGTDSLPVDCRHVKYHESQTAGFIHILEAKDYLGVLQTLIVPEDIRRYFEYREDVCLRMSEQEVIVQEQDIIGAFLHADDLPSSTSRIFLGRFLQHTDDFDLSPIISNLHEHIVHTAEATSYYSIMLEFARVPRSVWREAKLRFMKCVEAANAAEFQRPLRFAFPATNCNFMFAALDPKLPVVGNEGEAVRTRGLQNLTIGAMYDTKMPKGIGVLVSKSGEYFHVDWAYIENEWTFDAELEKMLATNSPFGPTKDKLVDSFHFYS